MVKMTEIRKKIGHRCPKKWVLGKIKLRDFQYILMTPIQGNIMQKKRYTRPGIDFNGENMQKNGANDRNTQKNRT